MIDLSKFISYKNILGEVVTIGYNKIYSQTLSTKNWGPKWANALFTQNLQHSATFSKLIREMPLFCNSIFLNSSFNVKLDF